MFADLRAPAHPASAPNLPAAKRLSAHTSAARMRGMQGGMLLPCCAHRSDFLRILCTAFGCACAGRSANLRNRRTPIAADCARRSRPRRIPDTPSSTSCAGRLNCASHHVSVGPSVWRTCFDSVPASAVNAIPLHFAVLARRLFDRCPLRRRRFCNHR
eukprot:125901-Rhodomonas_salina.1